jgi:hypothetical protein
LAAERKPSPGDPTQLGTPGTRPSPDSGRLHTPVPHSREQATENALDAREVGTATMMIEDETGERRTVQPQSGDQMKWSSYAPPPESFREAQTEPAEAPEFRAEYLASEPQLSAGYYSVRPPRDSAVEIPRAPRVPHDLGAIEEYTRAYPAGRTRRATPDTAPSIPPSVVERSDSSYPETIRTPPPDLDVPSERPRRRSSTPPPPMQEVKTLAPPPPDFTSERRSSYPAPRLYFAPHVRNQAGDWARTGSLSLPGCSSPRHARALQRALLLALLHDPGWEAIPDGLKQRAGWLFCEGWESNSSGHALRELDDLATVLGLPSGADSRRTLKLAISGVLPELRAKRAPSSRPPSSNSPPSRR